MAPSAAVMTRDINSKGRMSFAINRLSKLLCSAYIVNYKGQTANIVKVKTYLAFKKNIHDLSTSDVEVT